LLVPGIVFPLYVARTLLAAEWSLNSTNPYPKWFNIKGKDLYSLPAGRPVVLSRITLTVFTAPKIFFRQEKEKSQYRSLQRD